MPASVSTLLSSAAPCCGQAVASARVWALDVCALSLRELVEAQMHYARYEAKLTKHLGGASCVVEAGLLPSALACFAASQT